MGVGVGVRMRLVEVAEVAEVVVVAAAGTAAALRHDDVCGALVRARCVWVFSGLAVRTSTRTNRAVRCRAADAASAAAASGSAALGGVGVGERGAAFLRCHLPW